MSCRFKSLVAALILMILQPAACAQIVGDIELLKRVAVESRANRDAIQTWQGEAELKTRFIAKVDGGGSDITRLSRVEFAYERATNRLMYLHTQTEEKGTKGKEIVADTQVSSWGRITTDDMEYSVQPWRGDLKGRAQSRPVLVLEARSKQKRGEFGPEFDPFLSLEVQGLDVYQRLMGFYDHAAELKRGKTTVAQTDNRVVLSFDTGSIQSRYVFDLAKGANPVEVETADKNIKRFATRQFQRVNGIWLPSRASATYKAETQGIETELTIVFTNHVLNKSIPAEEFIPEKLGIRKGDLVRDRRTGIEYPFEGSPGLSGGWWNKYWRYVVVCSLVLLAGTVTGVGWRIRRSRTKETQRASAA